MNEPTRDDLLRILESVTAWLAHLRTLTDGCGDGGPVDRAVAEAKAMLAAAGVPWPYTRF